MRSSFLKILARLLKFVKVKNEILAKGKTNKRRAAIALGDTEEAIFLCDRKQRKVRDLRRENIRTSCWIKIEGNELSGRTERGDHKKYSFMCRISREKVWGRARGDNGLGGLEAHIRLPNPLRPAHYNVVSTLARPSP